MSTERIVIVAYKPLPGKENALHALVKDHHRRLHDESLVSDRTPVLLRAKDGTVLEIFGWKSADALKEAHENPQVQQIWSEFAEVCEYRKLAHVAEAQQLFSEFSPL